MLWVICISFAWNRCTGHFLAWTLPPLASSCQPTGSAEVQNRGPLSTTGSTCIRLPGGELGLAPLITGNMIPEWDFRNGLSTDRESNWRSSSSGKGVDYKALSVPGANTFLSPWEILCIDVTCSQAEASSLVCGGHHTQQGQGKR